MCVALGVFPAIHSPVDAKCLSASQGLSCMNVSRHERVLLTADTVSTTVQLDNRQDVTPSSAMVRAKWAPFVCFVDVGWRGRSASRFVASAIYCRRCLGFKPAICFTSPEGSHRGVWSVCYLPEAARMHVACGHALEPETGPYMALAWLCQLSRHRVVDASRHVLTQIPHGPS